MSDIVTVTAEAESAGTRLDAYLSSVTDQSLSRTYIQKLLAREQVEVNGTVQTQKKYKVQAGDVIQVHIPEPEAPAHAEPENIPLTVVYEDEDVIVIDKPRGMVVHPAPGNETGTLVNALLYHCRSLSSVGGVARPGIVHRIDKDTSGLLMAAKNDRAHLSLSEQLREHTITRIYEAIVWNNIKEESGTVDAPLGRDPNNRFRMAVVPGGRRAVTHFQVLERFGQFTRIQCRLETGRTHQIRVHMASRKHPLLGDTLYGPAKQPYGAEGQMLHARVLGFVHPRSGEYLEFQSEPPAAFQQVLGKLRG